MTDPIPQAESVCAHCEKTEAEHTDNPADYSNCGEFEPAPAPQAPQDAITDEARKQFVLRAIALRQKTDPKFGVQDIFPDCNFGSLDAYSGVTADLALRELAEAREERDRAIQQRDQFLEERQAATQDYMAAVEERDRAQEALTYIEREVPNGIRIVAAALAASDRQPEGETK